MQNLTIATAPPDTQASAPTGNNSAEQATEPFGDVFARQCSGASAPGGDQPVSSLVNWIPGNETADEAQAPITDAVGMLPAGMLAAFLPAPVAANLIAPNEKSGARARSPDGVSALPGDMLAVLLPAPAQVAGADAAMQRRQGAAVEFGETGLSAGNQAELLFRAQGNAMPAGADAGGSITRSGVFPAALAASGKDVANTSLSNSAVQISAQPDTAALPGLVQTGATPIAASQNGPAQTVVGAPLAQDARARDVWSGEFSQKITWLATQHQQIAELHLNPPHLGPLDVVLSVSGDQTTALFVSPHAAVRDAVEQALPKLREMLADSGIMLGNATVSDQAPRERQKGEGWTGKGGDPTPVGGIQVSATDRHGRRHQGMVDTFA